MPKQEEKQIVSYTRDQMFDLVSNIDEYKEFLPWCNDSKIISRERFDDYEVVIADLEIGYDQFVYTYRSEVKLAKDKSFINVKNLDGPFKYLVNEWKFADVDENNSEIEFMIDFELNLSLLDVLMKKFFNLAFQRMVSAFIDRAKDKDDPFRLMGFGHRVYKNFDPRAKIIKKAADDVLGKLGVVDPVLDIAKKLEEVALNDDYFQSRGLYPNVDFYSGIIYRALGIPTEMFTVMFALGRLPGWIAQWKEMMHENQPISRTRQIYTGETARDFVDIDKR